MPYIKQEDRKYFREFLKNIPYIPSGGFLNYVITKICLKCIKDNGESYKTYNDVVGALECCRQELYRRKIAPHEDIKIKENGDVYES